MKSTLLVFLLLCSTCFAIGSRCNEFLLLDGWHEDNSVLKIWFTVLGLCDEVDRKKSGGFAIHLEKGGKYYDASKGDNWWTYYFAFDSMGEKADKKVVRIPRYQRSLLRFRTACTISPERGHELVEKYMMLKPELREKLQKKTGEVRLGVYYQLPMMPEIQKSWDFEELCQLIAEEKRKLGADRIYLFTEIEELKQLCQERFQNVCLCFTYHAQSAVQRGEEELLTMYLLAECDALIAPGSYYSIGSKFLNPKLKVLELSPFPYLCD